MAREGYRIETDSLGEMEVPMDKLYGAQTQRCLNYFQIGGEFERQPFPLVIAIGVVKKACAETNKEFGLDCSIADTISKVCDEVITGDLYCDHFPAPKWQSGAGTASNMNANEVISNRAIELLGGVIGTKNPVHPNDHVNMGQSTNDVIPTSMNVAVVNEVHSFLLPGLKALRDSFNEKSREYCNLVKVGRTHFQDAVPITLGQEFSAYVEQLNTGITKVEEALPKLYLLNIGGTAVGTGLNQYVNFDRKCVKKISEFTGYPFEVNPNKIEGTAASDGMVLLSGVLNLIATFLMKIQHDIKFLTSGPRCGLGEISIPENEPGSSIMPGKVNPTHCDSMGCVCAQVMGNHVAITIGCMSGHLDLNTYRIMIVSNVLQSVRLLGDCCLCLSKFCVDGIKANKEVIERQIKSCLMLGTALNPHVGYDKAAAIAHKAHKENTTLREAAAKLGISNQQFDEWVKPEEMVRPKPYHPKISH